jgi:NADPH:quinone reductase-like Zn-dependent oxidoreductase
MMKAIVHTAYGPADEVLKLRDIPTPVPGAGQVLVRVRAASMHPDVWHMIEGIPYVARFMGNGVTKPNILVPGTDLAGVVESVGANVTRFKAGDEVFGESAKFAWQNGGAFAEYAAVPAKFLALKPANVTLSRPPWCRHPDISRSRMFTPLACSRDGTC